MRRWRFTRKSVSPAETALLAFVAAVGVHAIFLLPDYRVSRVETDSSDFGVQVLNLSSLTSSQNRHFQNWLQIHDPAEAARSQSKSGYSAAWTGIHQYQVKVTPYKNSGWRSQAAVTRFSPLSVPAFSGGGLPGEKPEKSGKTTVVRRVKVLDSMGKEIPGLIGEIPPEMGSHLPTVITLSPVGRVVRTELNYSSISKELDLLALKAAAGLTVTEKTVLTVIWPGRKEK